MQTKNQELEVVFFNVETQLKIGGTTYVVKSFYDNDGGEDLVAKLKRLMKSKVHETASSLALNAL